MELHLAKSDTDSAARLKRLAGEEWKRVAALLAKRCILGPEDLAALYLYATSYAQYRDATEHMQTEGAVVLSNTGIPIRNPWATIQNQAWDRIRPLLSELGLTPTARARLKLDALDAAQPGADFF